MVNYNGLLCNYLYNVTSVKKTEFGFLCKANSSMGKISFFSNKYLTKCIENVFDACSIGDDDERYIQLVFTKGKDKPYVSKCEAVHSRETIKTKVTTDDAEVSIIESTEVTIE